ncbi:MAG: NTP transferase domain-containing protein [Magnetococcales bacterium]|nr:NTP transferase domain-containing protein [Magnetococcales bacterium]
MNVEEPLSRALRGRPVVILCGGRGVRLLPLTERVPKGMVRVNGKPLLEHVVAAYRRQGAERFVLCTGYRGEVIRDHFATPPPGVEMLFSDIGPEAGMLQRLMAGRDRLPRGEGLLLAYCDTVINLDGDRLMESHRRAETWGTLVTATARSPFGLVRRDESGRVTAFDEKPTLTYYIGAMLLEAAGLDEATPEMIAAPDGAGLVALVQRLIALGKLSSYQHDGLQVTINTPSEHQEAEAALARYYTYRESAGSGESL